MSNMAPENIAPGIIMNQKLKDRGWTQADLAEVLGKPAGMVSEIIQGKRGITPETALLLAQVFDLPANYWLSLQNAYTIANSKVENSIEADVSRRAKLYSAFPIRDMIKRGWIMPTKDVASLEAELQKFSSPSFSYAARKSNEENKEPLQNAWLYRVYNLSKDMVVPNFSPEKLQDAFTKLKPLLFESQEIYHIPRILRESGIRFLLVEALPNSKIDGVCFWLDNKSPVVALSLRSDKVDRFWFTLLHELKHVEYKHGLQQPIIDENINEQKSDISEEEALVNRKAAEFLISESEISNFIARVKPFFSPAKIEGFARRIGVHPGIVVGQLQHRGLIPWNQHTKVLVNVRNIISSTSMCDGWGMIL